MTCDPGVDDAVALAVAAGRADCDVRAVVAGAGNVDAATAWRNAAGLVALFGLDVPVGIGSAVALGGATLTRGADPRPKGEHRPHGVSPHRGDSQRDGGGHGRDGLGGLSDRLPAVSDTPADAARLVRGQVIALGPLTDVALARRAGRPIERVVWMGGTIGWTAPSDRSDSYVGPGRPTGPASPGEPASEFNASADVGAVDEVLKARLDVSIVPIDVTRQVTLDRTALDRWDAGPAAARLCAALVRTRRRAGSFVLHDPVAVVAALEPDLFTWQLRPVRCSTSDVYPRGVLLSAPKRSGPARVAVAVDAVAVRRRIAAAVAALAG